MTHTLPSIERTAARSPIRRASQRRTPTGPLVVTSGRTGAARGALHVAELLARRDRVNAHVVGLLRPVEVPRWMLDSADAGALEEGVRRQRRGRLRQEVHATVGRSSLFSTEMLVGASIQTLREAALARSAEHVLVGLDDPNTPDRIRDERLVLQLARIVDRPVLAVPRGCAALPARAVVAVDGGPASERAARAAARVLAPGGTLTLARVAPLHEGDALAASDSHAPNVAEAADRLERVALAIGDLGRTVLRTEVLPGDPVTALLELARRQECDLIACGMSGNLAQQAPRLDGAVAALLDGASGIVLIAPPADVDRSRSTM